MPNIRNSTDNCTSPRHRISCIDTTSDCLSPRGGLVFFARYLEGIALLPHLERLFGSIRFLVDGTSRHLTYFDELRQDTGYAAVIRTPASKMISSHQIKRFLVGFCTCAFGCSGRCCSSSSSGGSATNSRRSSFWVLIQWCWTTPRPTSVTGSSQRTKWVSRASSLCR